MDWAHHRGGAGRRPAGGTALGHGESRDRLPLVPPSGWGHFGKEHTQKIASKHINLRTRITRLVHRPICFSRSSIVVALVLGLLTNRSALGRCICDAIDSAETPSTA